MLQGGVDGWGGRGPSAAVILNVSVPDSLPAAAAFVVAAGGALLARRRPGLMPAVAPLAALAGWSLLLRGGWTAVLWPRALGEYLLLPGLVIAGVGALSGLVRSRWVAVGVAGFVGWWLAGSGAGRPEFWRVWFASVIVAWVLTRLGAAQPRRALAVCLAVAGGLLAGSGPAAWLGIIVVLAAAALGVAVEKRAGVVAPGLLMLGLTATELGAGRLVRGGLGLVDLTCLGALVAPWAMAPAERLLRRRRKGLEIVAAPLVAAAIVAGAWVVWRVLLSF